MASSMKLFQSVQSFYCTMGVYPPEPNQRLSFRLKRIFFPLSSFITFLALVAFFFFEAQTVEQYASAFHGSITELVILADFHIIAWQMPNILKLIENFERFIEKRKHKSLNRISIIFFSLYKNIFLFQIQELRQMCPQKYCTMD